MYLARLLKSLFTALVLALGLCTPVWAYIDPNAGGVLFQLLAPLFAAAVGAWLFFKRWIKDWVRRAWTRLTGGKAP
jgi:hypothetical protein